MEGTEIRGSGARNHRTPMNLIIFEVLNLPGNLSEMLPGAGVIRHNRTRRHRSRHIVTG